MTGNGGIKMNKHDVELLLNRTKSRTTWHLRRAWLQFGEGCMDATDFNKLRSVLEKFYKGKNK